MVSQILLIYFYCGYVYVYYRLLTTTQKTVKTIPDAKPMQGQWSSHCKKLEFLLSLFKLIFGIWNSQVKKPSYGLSRHKIELSQIVMPRLIFRKSDTLQ